MPDEALGGDRAGSERTVDTDALSDRSAPREPWLALVLGGGNALGAYHAGAYEALDRCGKRPNWVVGASAGAVVGAIIAGNAPEERVKKLHRFWSEAT